MSKDNTLSTTETSVICVEHPLNHGKRLGILRLNSVQSLNALTLDMIKLIHSQLEGWKNDDNILAVWLRARWEFISLVDAYEGIIKRHE